jgi:hypothetical protein
MRPACYSDSKLADKDEKEEKKDNKEKKKEKKKIGYYVSSLINYVLLVLILIKIVR